MASFVLNKAILAHAPDFNVGCAARLRIAHDQNAKLGSISVRITADLAGLDSGRRVVMLNIRPDMVDTCTVASTSNDNLIPSHMFPMAPTPVTKASAVSTLILCLNQTGVVLGPSEVATLSPSDHNDGRLHAFAKVCQSRIIRLHFSKRQFANNELVRLQSFARALRARDLGAESIDYARLDAGRGVEERDWRVFDRVLDPPPYDEAVVPADRVLGKRPREGSSSSPPFVPRKPHAVAPYSPPPPPGSPTEVNTPSSCASSPSNIRPTKLIRTTVRPDLDRKDRLLRLQQELRDVPDQLVREVLIGSGHQHLLAATPSLQEEGLAHSSRRSPKQLAVSASQIEEMIDRRLNEFVDQRFTALSRNAFKSLTQRRLDRLVEAQLPVAAEMYLSSAVSEHRDQFYEECKIGEANIHETVESGVTEVQAATDECLREIRGMAQQCKDEIDDHNNKQNGLAEDTIAELGKRWFAGFTEDLLYDDKNPCPSVAPRAVSRRSSA